ncbi:MAG: cytochrome c oxidase subunit 3 [Pseudobdellovibrionaceae bacterium]
MDSNKIDSSYKSRFGMWIFLGTETLLFGGLFLALFVNFYLSTPAFKEAIHHMDISSGAWNTFILLTSSWTMALALYHAQQNRIRPSLICMALTLLLAAFFLVIKASEYYHHWQEKLVPGLNWHPTNLMFREGILFFFMYFVMTLLHSLHLLIGMGLISVYGFRYAFQREKQSLMPALENIGLYWHFVDIVWIFLFPSLYLLGRI